jgi:hypothetical protein
MAPNNPASALGSRTLRPLRRPLLGPVLFGLILGGIPLGVVLSIWYVPIMDSPPRDSVIGMFLLFTILVATFGAVLGGSSHWKVLFYRALLISLAMCIPIPLVVDLVMLSKTRAEVFDIRNFPFHVILCVVWSIEVTVAVGLLALGYSLYRGHRSRVQSSRPRA